MNYEHFWKYKTPKTFMNELSYLFFFLSKKTECNQKDYNVPLHIPPMKLTSSILSFEIHLYATKQKCTASPLKRSDVQSIRWTIYPSSCFLSSAAFSGSIWVSRVLHVRKNSYTDNNCPSPYMESTFLELGLGTSMFFFAQHIFAVCSLPIIRIPYPHHIHSDCCLGLNPMFFLRWFPTFPWIFEFQWFYMCERIR